MVEISSSQTRTSDKSLLTETIHSDPVTLQFMCVTHEQDKALPVQVKERINIHKVKIEINPIFALPKLPLKYWHFLTNSGR